MLTLRAGDVDPDLRPGQLFRHAHLRALGVPQELSGHASPTTLGFAGRGHVCEGDDRRLVFLAVLGEPGLQTADGGEGGGGILAERFNVGQGQLAEAPQHERLQLKGWGKEIGTRHSVPFLCQTD